VEIFAKRGCWSWLNFSQPSAERSPGWVDQPSIRPAADRLPATCGDCIIRTVAVSIAAESWRDAIELALRLRRTPFPGSPDIQFRACTRSGPASAALELTRRSRVESLGQEKGRRGIVGVRCTRVTAGALPADRPLARVPAPADKGRDLIGTQLPDRSPAGALWCGHGRCGRWRRCMACVCCGAPATGAGGAGGVGGAAGGARGPTARCQAARNVQVSPEEGRDQGSSGRYCAVQPTQIHLADGSRSVE